MELPKTVMILGAGGHVAEVIEAAHSSDLIVTSLFDDHPSALGREIVRVRCLGQIKLAVASAPSYFHVAIGANEARRNLAQQMNAAGHKAISIVHRTAVVSSTAEIGPGAYVGAGAFVGPYSKIGAHSIVSVGTSIGHNSVLGSWSQVCPGARISGFAVLGDGAFVGSNAVVGPGVTLGEWSRLGAASFARKNVAAHALAAGVPACIIAG